MKQTILILVSGMIVGGIFIAATSQFKPSQNTAYLKTDQQAKASPSINNVKPEAKRSSYIDRVYVNPTLGIRLSTEKEMEIDECRDQACVTFDSNLRIETSYLNGDNTEILEDRIIQTDLICSAGGPMGSIDCENIRIEEYINQNGFQGYKVFRKIDNSDKELLNDHTYVFTDLYDDKDEILVIQVESHQKEDLLVLDSIVETLEKIPME